jgi:hypothetical protein
MAKAPTIKGAAKTAGRQKAAQKNNRSFLGEDFVVPFT